MVISITDPRYAELSRHNAKQCAHQPSAEPAAK